MFCGKCGVKNPDDATFCTGCGAKLNGEQSIENNMPVVVNTNDKNRKVGMIAVAVIAIIAIALLVILFGGRSYKAAIRKFVNAQLNGDVEAIFELIPDKMISYGLKDAGYDEDEFDEFKEELDEELEYLLDQLEEYFGEGAKISNKILTVEGVTGEDLDDLKNSYKNIDINVSAAKTVECELTVEGGETEVSGIPVDISLIKVGRSWYLDLESMGGIF